MGIARLKSTPGRNALVRLSTKINNQHGFFPKITYLIKHIFKAKNQKL